MIVISACLAGIHCRYDGAALPIPNLVQLCAEGRAIAVCPEQCGGLPTPREPAEKTPEGKYLTITGKDVTLNYKEGALSAWEEIKDLPIKKAILKSKSPMCGVKRIYDGSFSGNLIQGQGEFAKLLTEKGITVEEED